MKTGPESEKAIGEMQFELKYCERCGGLWLRPAGGRQIYCAACGREMAKLPTVSRDMSASMADETCWRDDEDLETGESGEDMSAMGGVA